MKDKRSIQLLAILMIMGIAITACGKKNEVDIIQKEETTVEAVEEQPAYQDVVLEIPDYELGSNVIKSGDIYFFISTRDVCRYNSVTKEYKVLYSDNTSVEDLYCNSSGSGLLVNDKIYFTQVINNEGTENTSDCHTTLSMVDINGEAYSVIDKYPEIISFRGAGSLMLKDNMIYVDVEDSFCYELDDEGNVTMMISPEEVEAYKAIPEGYTICSYNAGGNKSFFPAYTIAEAGVIIAQDNEVYESHCINVTTGEETTIPGAIISSYGTKMLLSNYEEESYLYGIFDMKDLSYKSLLKSDEYLDIVDMDDTNVYYVEPRDEEGFKGNNYCSIAISNGARTTIGSYEMEKDALDYTQTSAFAISVDTVRGELYTVCCRDYAMHYGIYNLAAGTMEAMPEPYFDSGIGDIGTLSTTHKQYKEDDSNPDSQLLLTLDTRILNIKSEYPGASKINMIMNEYAKGLKANAERSYKEIIADGNYKEEYFSPYSIENSLMKVTYNEGDILCFMQSGYEYFGGAHGMPYWSSFIFNLQTGKSLGLGDIVGISEEKLKEEVVKAFKEQCYEGDEDSYWEDSVDSVKQYTDFTMEDFYLTEDGITFYYSPYLLASYAMGFVEVHVPYEDLDVTL